MSLESLVEEIRRRGEADVQAAEAEERAAAEKLGKERDDRIAQLRAESAQATAVEIARERAQRLAGAKLESRKKLYEARERRLARSVTATRQILADFTESDDYPGVLKRMCQVATEELGKQLRIGGRAEDAGVLQKVAGKAFDPTPFPILGGLVAQTADGRRRLNLSFDELLRLREDRVRDLLA